jgi:hypothetical protein
LTGPNLNFSRVENEMESDGFLILPQFLNPKNLLKILEPYRKRTQYIFNGEENDHKRRQMSLSVDVIKEFRDALLELPFLTSAHCLDYFVLLRSLPGCTRQLAHTDYIPDEELLTSTPETRPLLCVLALEDNTKLVVWPGSHKVIQGRGRSLAPIEPRVVRLNAGDAIVFRADLVHAGAEYEEENIRVHCYIDSKAVQRNPNRTWIISKHADDLVQQKILEP